MQERESAKTSKCEETNINRCVHFGFLCQATNYLLAEHSISVTTWLWYFAFSALSHPFERTNERKVEWKKQNDHYNNTKNMGRDDQSSNLRRSAKDIKQNRKAILDRSIETAVWARVHCACHLLSLLLFCARADQTKVSCFFLFCGRTVPPMATRTLSKSKKQSRRFQVTC